MKAMILAAGFGQRLSPLTNFLPKPVIPVLNKPLIKYSLELLKKNKFTEVVVNIHHLYSKMIDILTSANSCVKIIYSIEKEILGTGGGIKKQEKYLKNDDCFIVINGDIIIDIDIQKLIKFHKEKKAIATMVLRKDKKAEFYGSFDIDNKGRIIRFLDLESTRKKETKGIGNLMFTGVHILSREIFDYLPSDSYSCITNTFYKKAFLEQKKIYAYIHDGFWSDLGTIKSYFYTSMKLLKKYNAKIKNPCMIGKDVIIENNVKIGPYAIIGNNCLIKKDSSISNSILWDNTIINSGVKLDYVIKNVQDEVKVKGEK
jgi:NDP-sugar pyrophosphorylase family protein